ncbi:hypothetical protein J2Z21_000553 [Streptomyces griseochromogenes]|uniref:Uncharacterized protein n=1 Tax=Streptomyces griseochromogenes TaxID=68214 RepID=A0ABS4LJT2_9ACTN|nr:hypothetical protein [Streptomyces griseochromogenes]
MRLAAGLGTAEAGNVQQWLKQAAFKRFASGDGPTSADC